jgi:hypothetical protein
MIWRGQHYRLMCCPRLVILKLQTPTLTHVLKCAMVNEIHVNELLSVRHGAVVLWVWYNVSANNRHSQVA